MEMTFFRAVLNKTKDRIRITNIIFQLGVDEINYIENGILRWLGYVMWMRKERIPKKMLCTKLEGKRPRGRSRPRWIDQMRKDIKMGGENWEEIQENRK